MKKISLFVVALAMIISLGACGGSSDSSTSSTSSKSSNTSISVTDNRQKEEPKEAEPVVEVTDSDFEVKQYIYENSIGTTTCYMIVKNNSNAVVSISANGVAKDASGNTIGADDMSIDVLGPGEESIGYFWFSDVSGVETVDYTLSYSTDLYYSPVLSDLSAEVAINNKNVVVTVTNNGENTAEFVEAYAIFFDASGNIVGANSSYIGDGDSEIKPGATMSDQISAYDAFENVEIYLTGRHSEW